MSVLRRRTMSAMKRKTLLLLHFESNVDDSSLFHRGTTLSGNGSYSSGKFGKALSNSTVNYSTVRVEDIAGSIVRASEFTIEGFIQPLLTTNSDFSFIIHTTSNMNNTWFFISFPNYTGTTINIRLNNTFQNPITIPPISRSWHHFAMVYKDGVVSVFFNGVKVGTTQVALTFYNIAPYANLIFRNYAVDEFRISSIARYSSDFIPPTMIFQPD